MSVHSANPVDIQRAYYARTANAYDRMHVAENDEHGFALAYMLAFIEFSGVKSVLDVGSGTGRALIKIKEKLPHVRVAGVEPSRELRKVGYEKGLSEGELVDGDATKLVFDDGSFDLVCEYGALHHISRPSAAVSEMLRVASRAVFISDCNNFGQGRKIARLTKQLINSVGAWPVANFIKTRGKIYSITEGDGLAYSYSVFNDYSKIRAACRSVHMLNTMDSGPNLYREASHVALLGIK